MPRRGIVIGEVAGSESLRHWATRRSGDWLMAGGAEFFGALLKPGKPCPEAGLPPGRELFVCGSASEATRKFVASQAQKSVPVFPLPGKLVSDGTFSPKGVSRLAAAAVAAFKTETRVILHVGLPQVRDESLAGMLALHLVRVAEQVLHSTEVRHVFAEGGATAVALARCLGWKRLPVAAELAPGVATLLAGSGSSFFLTIKPGSYPWPGRILAATNRNTRSRRDRRSVNSDDQADQRHSL